MRLLHFGDVHLREGARWDQTIDVLAQIVQVAKDADIHAWLCGGDLWGSTVPYRPTNDERRALASGVFYPLAARAPGVVIAGNHDDPGEVEAAVALAHDCVVPYPVHVVAWRPCSLVPLQHTGTALCLVAVPFPSRRATTADSVEGGRVESATQYLAMLRALRGQIPAGALAVGLLHISTLGAPLGGGEQLIGREIQIAPHDLDELQFDFVGLSHIHEQGQVAECAWNAGAPLQQNFGETVRKGCNLITVEPDKPPVVEFVPLKSRPMITVRTTFADGLWVSEAVDVPADAEVRIVATINEQDATNAPPPPQPVCHCVRIDRRVVPFARGRAVEIAPAVAARALSPAEALRAWAEVVSPTPDAVLLSDALRELDALKEPEEEEEV